MNFGIFKSKRRKLLALKSNGDFEVVVRYSDRGMERAMAKRLGSKNWIESIDTFFVSNVFVTEKLFERITDMGEVDEKRIVGYATMLMRENMKTLAIRGGCNVTSEDSPKQIDEDGEPCEEYVSSCYDNRGYA